MFPTLCDFAVAVPSAFPFPRLEVNSHFPFNSQSNCPLLHEALSKASGQRRSSLSSLCSCGRGQKEWGGGDTGRFLRLNQNDLVMLLKVGREGERERG